MSASGHHNNRGRIDALRARRQHPDTAVPHAGAPEPAGILDEDEPPLAASAPETSAAAPPERGGRLLKLLAERRQQANGAGAEAPVRRPLLQKLIEARRAGGEGSPAGGRKAGGEGGRELLRKLIDAKTSAAATHAAEADDRDARRAKLKALLERLGKAGGRG